MRSAPGGTRIHQRVQSLERVDRSATRQGIRQFGFRQPVSHPITYPLDITLIGCRRASASVRAQGCGRSQQFSGRQFFSFLGMKSGRQL